MKVAITEHQGRVAPVFDTSRRLLIFRVTGDQEQLISAEDWSSVARHARPTRLKELGVDAVVCGGISCRLEELVRLQGIHLIPWLAGDVSELLVALREGRIGEPRYLMPGRRMCKRRRRGAGRGVRFTGGAER